MAYFSTVDEKEFGSSAGDLDAGSSFIHTTARLVEGTYGYGFTQSGYPKDVDVYALGSLDPGHYSVNVDKHTWDYGNIVFGNIASFDVLNSYGSSIASETSTYSDIEFTVESSSSYYVEITGKGYGSDAQYRVEYTRTGDLEAVDAVNSAAIFSDASITGDHIVGQTLTANITYYDANGISGATPTVYWYAGSDSLGYGTSNTYTLTETDVGKNIWAFVSFNDDSGNFEASGLFGGSIVADSNSSAIFSDASITGDHVVGQTLTANITYSDANGITLYPPELVWLADGVIISEGSVNENTYTLTPSDVGKVITFGVIFYDDLVNLEWFELSGGSTVLTANSAPILSSSAILNIDEDTTSSAIAFSATDADDDSLTYFFSNPSKGLVINNDNGTYTYTPSANANGADSFTITVNDGSVDVIQTVSVNITAVNDSPSGSITITGTAAAGQLLNAVSTIVDGDGFGTLNYQWKADDVAITGATVSSYTLSAPDVGKSISVTVNFIDDDETFETVNSLETSVDYKFLDHSNSDGWLFYVGSDSNDSVIGTSKSVFVGGDGDDLFSSGDGADMQTFVGGSGADYYSLRDPSVMSIVEVNDGKENILDAPGIGLYSDSSFIITINNGQHLLVEDTVSKQSVWLIDWKDGGFKSSKVKLADGEYTAIFIEEIYESRPNYLGDFSFTELVGLGVAIPSNMSELIEDAKGTFTNLTDVKLSTVLFGDSYDNVVAGDTGNNTILGLAGNDIITGGAGYDMLDGGDGNDKISGGSGTDILYGGAGDDTIILESSGNFGSELYAYNTTSLLQTGTEESINLDGKTRFGDVMDGGADVDTVELTDSSDAFFLHDSFGGFHSSLTLIEDSDSRLGAARLTNIENITSGAGDDIVDLTSPDYSLVGQNITVDGGSGNDTLWGSDANETLKGGEGDDELFGGAGTNALTGGAGADEFQFTKTSTNDTVKDFSLSDGDTLKFFNTGGAQFDVGSVSLTGDELSISDGTGVLTITLEGAGLQLDDLGNDVLIIG